MDRAESNLNLYNRENRCYFKHPPSYPFAFAKNPTPTCYPMLMCPALLPTFCSNEHSSIVSLPRPTKHFVLAQIRFSIVATYRKESIVSRLMSASIPNLGDDNLSNPCIPLAAPSKVTTELQLLTMSKNFAPLVSFDMPFPTQSPNSIVWVMFFGWYSLGESASKER